MTPAELIAKGYRRVSNRGQIIARIDRPDWQAVLARELLITEQAVRNAAPGMWEDQYRRVFSNDTLIVKRDVYKQIPSSSHDPVGYVE